MQFTLGEHLLRFIIHPSCCTYSEENARFIHCPINNWTNVTQSSSKWRKKYANSNIFFICMTSFNWLSNFTSWRVKYARTTSQRDRLQVGAIVQDSAKSGCFDCFGPTWNCNQSFSHFCTKNEMTFFTNSLCVCTSDVIYHTRNNTRKKMLYVTLNNLLVFFR